MPKVSNRKIITKLSRRSLRANRQRNIVAVFAIALTAILFTTLFTIGGGILRTTEKNTQLMVGTSAHAGAKRLTMDEYERLASASSVRDISYNIILGFAENEALQKRQAEIRYSEEKSAKWGFAAPTVGKMPRAENETAMSTLTLDALSVPHRLGEEVPLAFTVNGVYYEENFVLSGYWEGNPVMPADQVWLSRAFADKVAPAPSVPFAQTDGTNYAGYIDAGIWFSNSFDLTGKTEKLLAESGLADQYVDLGVNWAYQTAEIDETMALAAVVFLILILVSGYLIIYNVFAISVEKDTRFFGLLKTIGATGKHLRRIVRRQALLLSVIGIPLGLALGYLLGSVLTPVLFRMTTYGAETVTLSANPLIFLFAAVFSLSTVIVSTARPGRMASRVSPIEAIRFTGAEMTSYQEGRAGKRAKPVTPLTMAFANLKRYPKKLISVTLSLSLSLILLGGVYSAVHSFDMEQYLAGQIVTDFAVTDASVRSVLSVSKNYEGIPDEFLAALSEQVGVTGIGNIYFKENSHLLADFAYHNALHAYDAATLQSAGSLPPYSAESMQAVREDHIVPLHIYGVNEFAASKIMAGEQAGQAGQTGQAIDYEKLNSGDYVLAVPFTSDGGDTDYPYYAPGDKIMLDAGGGVVKEYTVLDDAEYPYVLTSQHGHFTDVSFILSEPRFMELYGETNPMMTVYDVGPAYVPALEEWTGNYCAKIDQDLGYASRQTFEREFETLRTTYMILGGAISFILALIGVLNFLNSVTTSILARRRELAMLQSVGMTLRQLRKMLVAEGLSYVGLAIVFTMTIGLLLMQLLARGIAGQVWFFSWHFSLTPVLICIPVMLLISVCVTLVCCCDMRKENLIERLKEE